MKKLFSMMLGLVCAAGLVFAVSGCDKEGENEGTITNTMVLAGTTYEFELVMYHEGHGGPDFYHLDCETKNSVYHGHGEFPKSWVGKTTNLEKGEFFEEFNPQEGSSYKPNIKSGTIKITETEKGLHIVVDAVETSGDAFKMNVLAEDESKIDWSQR